MAEKKKVRSHKNTTLNLSQKLAVGFGTAAVLYVMVSLFFSSHFFLRTEINGYSCQFKTVEQVKEMIRNGCEEFVLTLSERGDKTETITSEQVSLQFIDDGKIEAIKETQKGYAWIGAVFKKPVYENAATITYSETGLLAAVDALEGLKEENMAVPKAAYPSYVEETQQFEIVEEELGTLINKDILIEEIGQALLSDQHTLNLHEEGCYVEPAFYSDDEAVVEANNQLNQYLAADITYDFGYTKYSVKKDQMQDWFTVDENSQVIIEESKVGDFVVWLANNYNTCGIRRTFRTPENTTVTLSGGTYGWRIHHNNEVARLIEDVKNGGTIERMPEYRQKGYERDADGNDLHDTYVAISIKAQTMWYYKNGRCLLTTPVVTGNTSKKMGTPTGVYAIAYKQRDHVLRGEDYESPVDYWMPFYEYRGIGIHDASWRAADAFGKEIYKTNGSHGCVNTPYDAVKKLFEIVEAGTPVVVY